MDVALCLVTAILFVPFAFVGVLLLVALVTGGTVEVSVDSEGWLYRRKSAQIDGASE